MIRIISLEGDSRRHFERNGCRLSRLRRDSAAGRYWEVGSGECALQQVDLILELLIGCGQVAFRASEAKDFRLERLDVVLGALTMGTIEAVNDGEPWVECTSSQEEGQEKDEVGEEGGRGNIPLSVSDLLSSLTRRCLAGTGAGRVLCFGGCYQGSKVR